MTTTKKSAKVLLVKRAASSRRLARLPDPPIFIGFGGTAALDWGTALTDYVQSVLIPTVGAEALSHFTSVWLDVISASSGALLDAAFTDIKLQTGREALRIFKIRRRTMFLPMPLNWRQPMDFHPHTWELGHGLDREAQVAHAQQRIEESERRNGGASSMLVLRVWCAWCIADALRKWCEAKRRGRDLTAVTWKRIYQLRVLTERMSSRTKQLEAERKVLPDMIRVAKNRKAATLPRKDKEGRIDSKARELRRAHPTETLNKFAQTVFDHLHETDFGKDLVVQKLKVIGPSLNPPLIVRKAVRRSSV